MVRVFFFLLFVMVNLVSRLYLTLLFKFCFKFFLRMSLIYLFSRFNISLFKTTLSSGATKLCLMLRGNFLKFDHPRFFRGIVRIYRHYFKESKVYVGVCVLEINQWDTVTTGHHTSPCWGPSPVRPIKGPQPAFPSLVGSARWAPLAGRASHRGVSEEVLIAIRDLWRDRVDAQDTGSPWPGQTWLGWPA